MVEKLYSSNTSDIKNVNALSEDFSRQTNDANNMLLDAYNALFNRDISVAVAYIENARSKDVNNLQVKESEKLLSKWITIFRNMNNNPNMSYEEKADHIIFEWYDFLQTYHSSESDNKGVAIPQNGKQAFQQYVASTAKELYLHHINEYPDKRNTSVFRIKFFHCLKLMGEYDKAIRFLEACFPYLTTIKEKAYILSHLADCHEQLKYIDNAKVFFRKTFELSPNSVKIKELQSSMITDILHIIQKENRYIQEYYVYWIPVYGYLLGYLNIKVKLSPIEVSNITQYIYNIEIKLQDIRFLGKDDPLILLPTFFSKIFLLLDYYSLSPSYNSLAQELLQKIARYDPFICKKLQDKNNNQTVKR